jgi:murein DD-endopeptidase MepM/ murein hydrolase activator NlpD
MSGGLDTGAAAGGCRSRFWPALLALGLVTGAGITQAPAQEIVRRVGRVTFRVDASQAFPGGVVVVRLGSRGRLGAAWALLDGRRAAFYSDGGVPRALVPVSTSAEAGPATLGVAIAARGGEQRVSIPITIASKDYRPRYVALSEGQRARLRRPEAAHDSRRLLAVLRTESPKPAPGLLLPPVGATGSGFGEPRTYTGAADVESRIDALQGERHRGLDYAVPVGTPVRAPAAGTVLFAGPLALSGETVVIDHGQGVLSVLQHLSRVDARTGDPVPASAVVGLSGDTGLAPAPMLQWRVYLHDVAVDPNILGPLL